MRGGGAMPGTQSEAAGADWRLSAPGLAQPGPEHPSSLAQRSPARSSRARSSLAQRSSRARSWAGSGLGAQPYRRPRAPPPRTPGPSPRGARLCPAPTLGLPTSPRAVLRFGFFPSFPSVLDQRESKVLRNADCTVAGAMEEDRGGTHGDRGEYQTA